MRPPLLVVEEAGYGIDEVTAARPLHDLCKAVFARVPSKVRVRGRMHEYRRTRRQILRHLARRRCSTNVLVRVEADREEQ
jgi:hypothetical protein